MNASNVITKLKNRQPSILGRENFREYAVLLPLVEVENETHILFEVRSMNLRSQPGDICFPGGKIDQEDIDQKHCAVRETSEELGIDEGQVDDVIPLDYMVSDIGRIIYPFIGRIKLPDLIRPNLNEVDKVFTVPLSYFLRKNPKKYKVHFEVKPEDNFPYDLIMGGKNYDWQARQMDEYFFQYNEKVIWGLTARILIHFLDLLNER